GCWLQRPHARQAETGGDLDGQLVNVYRSLVYAPPTVAQVARFPVSTIDLWARQDALARQDAALVARLTADPRAYDAELAGMWVYCASTRLGSGVEHKVGLRPRPHLSHTGSGIHAKGRRDHLPRLCRELQTRLKHVALLYGAWDETLQDTVLHRTRGTVGLLIDPPHSHGLRDAHLYAQDHDCAAAVREWASAHGENPLLRIALC